MLTQERDAGDSRTHVSSSREKTTNAEDASRDKSRRRDADRRYPHADSNVEIATSRKINSDAIVHGEHAGVAPFFSLQRVIDRCSFVELMLKRLYRRRKKDEDAHEQLDNSQGRD